MGDMNRKNLSNLVKSIGNGSISIGSAIKMIKGGTIGSGLLPTTGKPMKTKKKAKGGMVRKK